MAKEIKKWTTLESRYIIQRPWLTARVDKVQLPDGRINPEHSVLEYPEWVNIIAITREGQFVMVRQYRHAMDIVLDELCAGVMEQGETPLQAAQRELLEETGYGGGTWREIMTVGQNPSICNNITHCFLAEGVERLSDQHLDAGEDCHATRSRRCCARTASCRPSWQHPCGATWPSIPKIKSSDYSSNPNLNVQASALRLIKPQAGLIIHCTSGET